MLTAALKREVEITIEAAVMLAEPGTKVEVLAERIYDSEPALMKQLQRPWIIERPSPPKRKPPLRNE